MAKSQEYISKAYDLLKEYKGDNGYIIQLKNSVYAYKTLTLNDFQVEFITKNYNLPSRFIGKNVKLAQWWGEKNQVKFKLPFIPKVMEIGYYFGEAMGLHVFYARFRQSQQKGELVVCPNSAILTDFLSEDYNNLQIDFDIYNKLAKDGKILRPHQEEAIKFLTSRKKCILAHECGSGKTVSCIISALVGGFKRILIVCPASVKDTWRRELINYVEDSDVSVIEGFNEMKKGELEIYLGFKEGESGLKKEELLSMAKEKGKWNQKKFTITNYDTLSEFYTIPTEKKAYYETIIDGNGNTQVVKKEKTVVSRKKDIISKAMSESDMYQGKFDLIILDEAHRLSNMSSGRYKIISDFVKRSHPNAIFCVTGTPITNNPYNFYNILKIIDAPITRDWQEYVIRYCEGKKIFVKGERDKWTKIFLSRVGKSSWYDLTNGEKDQLNTFLDKNAKSIWLHNGASNLDELRERVKGYYLRREQCDFGKVVKKEVQVLQYKLNDRQKDEYQKVYDEFIQKQQETGNSVSLMIEGSTMRQWLAKEMIPYTKQIVDKHLSNGEKVIIICCFDEELYSLKEIYNDSCVIYNGKTSPKEKVANENKFMTDPNCKVFIGNITACGVGLTLTAANVCVFNNFSWLCADNEQAEDRIYRLSQKKDVTIYYQIFNDTFFEKMFWKVKDKETVINKIIINDKLK